MARTLVTDRAKEMDVRFVSSPELSDIAAISKSLFLEAMGFCAHKMGFDDGPAIVDLLRQNDKTSHSYFFYGLAKRVAVSLGMMDETVKSVYLYDYDATPEDLCFGPLGQGGPLVHLIVWTDRKTAALDSLLAILDRALAHVYADLLDKPQIKSLLDVQMIDNDDVDSCTGYGALLGSIHHRPIQIWAR